MPLSILIYNVFNTVSKVLVGTKSSGNFRLSIAFCTVTISNLLVCTRSPLFFLLPTHWHGENMHKHVGLHFALTKQKFSQKWHNIRLGRVKWVIYLLLVCLQICISQEPNKLLYGDKYFQISSRLTLNQINFITKAYLCIICIDMHTDITRIYKEQILITRFLIHRLTETEVNSSLTSFEFRHLLNNLTALRIRNVGGQNCECYFLFKCKHFQA